MSSFTAFSAETAQGYCQKLLNFTHEIGGEPMKVLRIKAHQAWHSPFRFSVLVSIAVFSSGALAQSATNSSSDVTACDRLAAHPFDHERVAEPAATDIDVDQAIRACEAAVKSYPDLPRFHFQLGVALARKNFSDTTAPRIFATVKRASDRGYLAAIYFLGVLKMSKRVSYTAGKDEQAGFQLLLEAARRGHVEAQARAPTIAGNIAQSKEDYVEAHVLAEKAVAAGNIQAMVNLGWEYLNGARYFEDRQQTGLKYLLKAERMGSLRAKALLGQVQSSFRPPGLERSFPRDVKAGVKRLSDAATGGDIQAAFVLGIQYLQGSLDGSIKMDKQKAIHWFCRAGYQGQSLIREFLPGQKIDCPR